MVNKGCKAGIMTLISEQYYDQPITFLNHHTKSNRCIIAKVVSKCRANTNNKQIIKKIFFL